MITTMKDLVDISTNGYLKMNPSRPQVSIGLGTCGMAAGGEPLYKALLRFREERGLDFDIVNVGCIGMCFAEPLVDIKLPGMPRVTYPDMDLCKLDKVLQEHLVGGVPVRELAMAQLNEDISECEVGRIFHETPYAGIPSYKDLPFFKKQMRIALRNCGIIDPEDVEQYIARGGYRSAYEILHGKTPESVIDEVKASGIRGRGGAGFPTGMKWGFARQAKGDRKYIICNADEGDPGAYMDRAVLEGDPHSVLEGMIVGGFAIGSDTGYIYCRAEYPLAIKRLRKAITQAEELGILGDRILGSDFSFRIIIMEGAGAFVCGEETALIGSIMGKRGEPRPRPPFPATHGLFGKPTNVNNVETWANIPLIFRKGAKWFAGIGTEKSTGTKVFSLVGQVNRAGLVEIPMGTTLKDIIYEIGGGMQRDRAFKAVQTGGPSGGCIPAQHLDVQITYESLKELGSIMGSGGMVAMNEDNCMVDVARYFLSFTAEESCGQCVPCRVGTRRMLQILERITEGEGRMDDIAKLEHLSVQVRDGSLCALGGSAPNPVLTTLRYFRKEFEDHIKKGKCDASVCANLFLAPCQNTCPAGTNVPGFISLISEGRYVDAYAMNKEDNPFPSVCGRICDHPCESRCNRNQLDGNLNVWALKRYCADRAFALSRDQRPKPSRLEPTGKRVAVVGGGPSGLSASYFLSRLGHKVTVFESSDRLGGMMRWGIPQYRLPRDVMDAEIQDILELGVDVRYNVTVGKDVMLTDLSRDYDAVYLAPGAQSDIRLNLENEDLPGVLHGMDLLERLNRGEKVSMGSSILIIGGGNVSVDVARNAVRAGVPKVVVCYRRERQDMPAYPEEIEEALKEGVDFRFLVEPSRLIVDKGRVVGAEFTRMRMGDYNKWGRRVPVPTGEKIAVYADNVITAVGQMVEPDFAAKVPNRIVTEKNLIEVDENSRTRATNVYSGGDAVLGPATAIEAIGTGKRAALKIDEMLSGKERFSELKARSGLSYNSSTPDNQGHMERQEPPALPIEQRRGCNAEVILCYSEEQARFEAQRCLRCDLSCRGDEE